MSKQSKTLRQVDEFAATVLEAAAVEIRRLHAQRDQLLEALKTLLYAADDGPSYDAALVSARAAIKQAEENT